jgi:hypothetical protein
MTPRKQVANPPPPPATSVDKPQQIIQRKGTELKAHAGRASSIPFQILYGKRAALAIECRHAGLIDDSPKYRHVGGRQAQVPTGQLRLGTSEAAEDGGLAAKNGRRRDV